MSARVLPVEERSQVATARRAAAEAAARVGFDEATAGRLALVVTELATNLVKHARGGHIAISEAGGGETPAVELLALDRGPGMNVGRALRDGFSTSGTPGTGLGAVQRLSEQFDVYSRPGAGTALFARVADRRVARARTALTAAGLAVGKPGETVCGDGWVWEERAGGGVMLIVDGLGHGPPAAEATGHAIAAFRAERHGGPAARLERIHRALRETRGAAVAIADVDAGAGVLRFAGVGNVAAIITSGDRGRHLVSHNGTAGAVAPRITEYAYPWWADDVLIMHTDGIATVRDLGRHPGLARRHPRLVAGVLYRDHVRGSDDATVVVVASWPPA